MHDNSMFVTIMGDSVLINSYLKFAGTHWHLLCHLPLKRKSIYKPGLKSNFN